MKKFALVAVTAAAIVPLLPAAAHAESFNTKCSPRYGTSQARVCVEIHTYDNGYKDVVGYIDYTIGTNVYSATTILQQCSGTGTNCSTVSANGDTYTSPYTHSFGHTYRARASWTDGNGVTKYVSVASPLAA